MVPHKPKNVVLRRLTALGLALLFLLQSAAQAGSGCLSAVLTARCCCSELLVETPTPAASQHECCVTKAISQHGPSAQEKSPCCCTLAPLPDAPSDLGASWGSDRKRHLPAADTLKFVQVLMDSAIRAQLQTAISTQLQSGPPGPSRQVTANSTATRLAQRGVIGLLSDLGTLLE